jgi:hypothetical protein
MDYIRNIRYEIDLLVGCNDVNEIICDIIKGKDYCEITKIVINTMNTIVLVS